MKKPNIKDFICSDCGYFHEGEYKEAVKKYKGKKLKSLLKAHKKDLLKIKKKKKYGRTK